MLPGRRNRDLEPEEVDRRDDRPPAAAGTRRRAARARRQQAADADAEKARQQDEVGEVRQQPDVGRHPADQRDFEEENEKRGEEDPRGSASRRPSVLGGSPSFFSRFGRAAVPLRDDGVAHVSEILHRPSSSSRSRLAVRSRKLRKNADAVRQPRLELAVGTRCRRARRCARPPTHRRMSCRSASGTRGRATPGRRASASAAPADRSS